MMVKLRIPVRPRPKNGKGICAEVVWAKVLKNGNYRLENQPVVIEGLMYRDIVKAKTVKGILTFQSLVCRVVS